MKKILAPLCFLFVANLAHSQSMLSEILSKKPTVIYTCPEGFTLEGSECKKRNVIPATPVYSCPEGQTLSGTMCIKTVIKTEPAKRICEKGFVAKGDLCVKASATDKRESQ